MIKLIIEAAGGADLRRQLLDLLAGTSAAAIAAETAVETAVDHQSVPTGVGPTLTLATATETPAQRATRAPRKPKTEPATDPNPGAETVEQSEDSPAAEVQSSTSAEPTASPAGSSNGVVTIEEIRNLTLEVVDKRGREKIEEILTQFGVPKATQVDEARRGELADMLREALDA